MCLDRAAHGVALQHPIFQGPLPVDVAFAETPTPESYALYYSGRDLGPTVQTWQVDLAGFSSGAEGVHPGVVASGWGFADSPDCEVIAGGINMKGPESVAIGRQGSFFHWGFAASPSGMTESGQRAFVNSIAYIDQFDGAPHLVKKEQMGRTLALDMAYRISSSERPAAELDYFMELYPKDLVAKLGRDDLTKYLAHFQANLDYLVPAGGSFEVDEDAKAFGLANHDVRLLDAAVGHWETDSPESARAQRILKRYIPQSFTSAADARAWLNANRSRLFFSDVGGYQFFVGPATPSTSDAPAAAVDAKAASMALDLEKPSRRDPVRYRADVIPAAARPGDTVTVALRVAVAKGWHMYAEVPTGQPYRPVTVGLGEDAGFDSEGVWTLPPSHPDPDVKGLELFEGDLVFLCEVTVTEDCEPGMLTVPVNLAYQVCDLRSCLPFRGLELEATVEVTSGK